MEYSQSNPSTSPNPATSPASPKSPSKIPRRISPKRIALPDLTSALGRAVKARGKTYSQITAFVCYWDDDNTRAQEDGETFSYMMADLFGVASQTFVMNHENPVPGWDLEHRICKPTLFIFFYAGHGTINQLNELSFTTTNKEKFDPWRTIDRELNYQTYPMDTFCILDCCYSGTAIASNPMTTHVLAAVALRRLRDPV